MSIYKRKSSPYWYIKFEVNGLRIRQSAGTTDKEEAEQKEAELKRQLWREKNLGDKPKRTWKESVVKFVKEKAHKKSLEHDIYMFKILDPYLKNCNLDDLTRTFIDDTLNDLQDERDLSNARVNRYASVISTVLNLACKEWEWIDKAPNIRRRKSSLKRIRWITQAEAYQLHLCMPDHLKNVVKIALATGLRKTNLLSLRWDQIDMQRKIAWIHADEAKGKRDIAIPLNQDALDALHGQIGKHQEFVFSYAGRPFHIDNDTWKRALKKAGIENFRFHDLRHTWASWHVQAGTSLQELMELGGWRSYDMVLRYAHLSSHKLSDAADRISTKSSHSNIIELKKKG